MGCAEKPPYLCHCLLEHPWSCPFALLARGTAVHRPPKNSCVVGYAPAWWTESAKGDPEPPLGGLVALG